MNREIIEQFAAAINQQDLVKLIELMAEDFSFVDTYGGIENKEAMKFGWQGYFDWFPDYRITIEDYLANDDFASIIGRASGSYLGQTEKYWEFPTAWKVVEHDGKITHWQVFCDSKKKLDSIV